MAEHLDKNRIEMGSLLLVKNLKRHPNENKQYYALKVENYLGDNEEWLLFTEREFRTQFKPFWVETVTDELKNGRMLQINNDSFLLNVKHGDKVNPFKITRRLHDLALTRAKRNPEDIPAQSKIADLLD